MSKKKKKENIRQSRKILKYSQSSWNTTGRIVVHFSPRFSEETRSPWRFEELLVPEAEISDKGSR